MMDSAPGTGGGYRTIDCSKGYVHRTGDDEPWAIRGLIHPAFEEPGWIKARNVVGWRGELERQAAAAGAAWKPFQAAE